MNRRMNRKSQSRNREIPRQTFGSSLAIIVCFTSRSLATRFMYFFGSLPETAGPHNSNCDKISGYCIFFQMVSGTKEVASPLSWRRAQL